MLSLSFCRMNVSHGMMITESTYQVVVLHFQINYLYMRAQEVIPIVLIFSQPPGIAIDL